MNKKMKTAIFTTAEFSWSQAKHSENTWPLQSTAQFMVHSWLSVFFFFQWAASEWRHYLRLALVWPFVPEIL